LLASEDNPNVNNKVFLLGSNREMKFIDMTREVIAAIEEITGLKGKIEFKNFPKEHKKVDVGDTLVDYRNFNKATGWEPKFSFKEGIRRTISFYKDRHKDYLKNE
jgi:nucleoside-diphosphate-sugar epimerase